MANRMATADARKNFAGMVKRSSKGERIKLTRYDKTIAILIPKKDLLKLEECESGSSRRRATPAGPRRKAQGASTSRR